MGKPRYTRKYPTYPEIPEIPENKRDTRKYPIVYFDTPTRPEPDPLPGILSNTPPDPTRCWKTLPAGHWSHGEQLKINSEFPPSLNGQYCQCTYVVWKRLLLILIFSASTRRIWPSLKQLMPWFWNWQRTAWEWWKEKVKIIRLWTCHFSSNKGNYVITVREANELRDQIARPNGSDAMGNFQRVAT